MNMVYNYVHNLLKNIVILQFTENLITTKFTFNTSQQLQKSGTFSLCISIQSSNFIKTLSEILSNILQFLPNLLFSSIPY